MKKLLFIIGILFLISCEEATMENSVENPESFTTLEMQNLEKDTVVMAKNKDFELFYIFNDKNMVISRMVPVSDTVSSMSIGTFIMFFIVFSIIGILIGSSVNNHKN